MELVLILQQLLVLMGVAPQDSCPTEPPASTSSTTSQETGSSTQIITSDVIGN